MKIKNSLKFFAIFISILFSISNLNSAEKNYYQDIVNDWNKIFPDKNRNAAGPKFFKYILDKEITYKDFVEYNKLYCAVSGSLISPDSTPEFVYLKENITEKNIAIPSQSTGGGLNLGSISGGSYGFISISYSSSGITLTTGA